MKFNSLLFQNEKMPFDIVLKNGTFLLIVPSQDETDDCIFIWLFSL